MEITHPAENTFLIQSGEDVLKLTQEEYEDIYYALPLEPSPLYMLLNETLLETGEERERLQAIVDRKGGVDESMTELARLIEEFDPDREVDTDTDASSTEGETEAEEEDADDWDDFEEELDQELSGLSDDSDLNPPEETPEKQ